MGSQWHGSGAKAEATTKGGIVLPETSLKQINQGTVLGVGPGTKEKNVPCKAGDQIFFRDYAGSKICIGEAEFAVITSQDVLAVVDQGTD